MVQFAPDLYTNSFIEDTDKIVIYTQSSDKISIR